MESIPFDFYITMIAASLSLCGLAGVIGLFKHGEKFDVGEKLIFRGILKIGLSITVGAFFPMILAQSFGDVGLIWAFSSYVYAVLAYYYTETEQISIRKGELFIRHSAIAFGLKWGGRTSAAIAYINIWPWPLGQSQLIVMWALLWGLAVVALRLYFFVKAVTDDISEEPIDPRNTMEVKRAKTRIECWRDRVVYIVLCIPVFLFTTPIIPMVFAVPLAVASSFLYYIRQNRIGKPVQIC
jgi:hypothetical protein